MQAPKLFAASLVCLCLASYARAEESDKDTTTLSLQFSGLKYAKTTLKTEASGESATQKSSSTITSDLVDAYIWASIGSFNLYLYPFQDTNALLSASYMVRDDVELGVDLGISREITDEPKSEESASIYGLWGTYYVPIGKVSLENSLVYDLSHGKRLATNAIGMEEEATIKGSYIKASIMAVVPLNKNTSYVAGIGYSQQKTKDNSDQKESNSQVALTLAAIRLSF